MSHETKLMELDMLLDALKSYSYSFASEADLQAGVAAALTESGWSYDREASLSADDRVDFLVVSRGGRRIALEVKVDGSCNEVARQLGRYCLHARVEAVILVTNRVKHKRVPVALADTPIEVVYVGGSLA